MAKKFVHLHVHTEYSLLDGLSKVNDLISHVKSSGMDAVAITDHGVMYGVVEFYKRCLKEGIKPILGMEGYTTNVNLKERPERGKFQNYHLLLLAKDKEGYGNLMRLSSIAHLEGYYYRPRVDRETLAKYSKGLICTSACAQGELAQSLISGNLGEAKKIAEWFLDVFGKDYYFEVQRHEYDKFVPDADNQELKDKLLAMAENEEKIFGGVKSLSRTLGIPVLCTNDAHYVAKEDANAQDSLVCIATGKNVSDINRLRFIDSPSFYIKSPEEMQELFSDIPESLENTVKVADKCDLALTLDKWYFPKYELTEGKNPEEELSIRAREGLKEKLPNASKEAKERLEYELDTIKKKGYSTYFLIMSDMARWAQERGIVTNTRGSTAGSLVAFAIGIVNINPLTYELPFERFLTPWRPSPPDIDFDIADDRREEVINYMGEKYGHDKVAQICTFGRMLAKAAVRDIARVLGYPYSSGDRIAKLIPLGSQGFPMSIDKALNVTPDLKNLYENDSDAKKIIDLAKQVEGNARHVSVHAAGLVIAPNDIIEFTPVQLDPEGRKVITQYDMDALDPNVSPGEAIGLLKFDLLGLRNLSILGESIRIVRETRGLTIDLHEIPVNDKKTFEMLSRGETMGVFQLSGSGMTRYLKELKPTMVEDLMAMVALYRPGPMAQIPAYIERKNNAKKVVFIDKRMKEYLGKSYGLIVYQDDVFMTAINIAGYTWEEADKFRKAVGKKIPAEMEKQKAKFTEGAVAKGVSREIAEELFRLIEPFSGYGFNKAHAASYGMVAYQTAYMKANYPVEYMTALLSAESGDSEKISTAVAECRRMKIKVLPPDINESNVGFEIKADKNSLTGRAIRFGISAIKNVGVAAIEAILLARKEGRFISLYDLCSKVDARKVNKKVLESLIKVGALSAFGGRAALLSALENVRTKTVKPLKLSGQQDLFREEPPIKKAEIKREREGIPEFSDEELQALERQLLGFSLSARPVGEIIGPLSLEATHKIFEISPHQTFGETVRVAGVVSDVRIIITKRSAQEMAFVRIEDETGSIEVVVFPRIFDKTRSYWIDYKPLLITGRVDSREESPSLIAEAIDTLETRTNSQRQLLIKIPKETPQEALRGLKKLLIDAPGDNEVVLVFEGNSQKLILPFRISWNETLAKQITKVLEGEALLGVE
ncbi:DNA polymerase III subunit alpha [Candidatus Woesebacteria bacterium GWC1_42_13]|uniref:DNA polymerase III subunit alpha n=2 Tax=Candidatus Woeseibacteriota TaxID=1752722 RepID=A0A1F7WUG6_9BACT|nr:MAG: DNA polymerase III subunit alpha [Candidatus Woesebacteria bacterium GWA1_42_12]OGM06423.1 MAG: DNA polymerase III subunit alpha [Candidatus Woesebacteria bacterium GWC1_42_13]